MSEAEPTKDLERYGRVELYPDRYGSDVDAFMLDVLRGWGLMESPVIEILSDSTIALRKSK